MAEKPRVSRSRPRGLVTPQQMIKQWKELRSFIGDEDALEALLIERDELWRIHCIEARWRTSVEPRGRKPE